VTVKECIKILRILGYKVLMIIYLILEECSQKIGVRTGKMNC